MVSRHHFISFLLLLAHLPLGYNNSEATQNANQDTYRILITPLSFQISDSSSTAKSDSVISQLIDTLRSNFQQHDLNTIECIALDRDEINNLQTDGESTLCDSTSVLMGDRMDVNAVLWWERNNETKYQPVFTVIDSRLPPGLMNNEKTLSTAIGEMTPIRFEEQANFNMPLLVRFLTGYGLSKNEKLAQAIELFEEFIDDSLISRKNNFIARFHLAGLYLQQGKIQKDVTIAKTNVDSAIQHYNKCLADSFIINDGENLTWIYNNLGVAYQFIRNYNQAIECFHHALKDSSKISDDDIIRIYNNLGNIFLFNGDWAKALETYNACAYAVERTGIQKNIAMMYDHLGHIYHLMMQRLNAIKYYEKSLAIKQQAGDNLGIAESYKNLGNVYLDKNDFAKAIGYFYKEIELMQQLHNEPRLARAYSNAGETFQQQGNYDSARICFQKSVELIELLDDAPELIRVSTHLAEVNYKLGNLDSAKTLYEQNMELAQELNDEHHLAKIYDRLADIYNKKSNWEQALYYYEQSANLHEKLNYKETLALILFNMGLIQVKQKNYVDGYQLMKRAMDIDEKNGYLNLESEKEFLKSLELMLDRDENR